jgi:hypothetical protein
VATFTIQTSPSEVVAEGNVVRLTASHDVKPDPDGKLPTMKFDWKVNEGSILEPEAERNQPVVHWDTTGLSPGPHSATLTPTVGDRKLDDVKAGIMVERRAFSNGDPMPVSMRRTANALTGDVALWIVIRKTTESISFESYQKHMDLLLCGLDAQTGQPAKDWGDSARDKHFSKMLPRRCLPYNDTDAYRLLKAATESFLTLNCGVSLKAYPFSKDDIDLLNSRDVAGSVSDVSGGWGKYLKTVNGSSGDQTLPYLAFVREKLRDDRVKAAIFPRQERDRKSEDEFGLPQECVGVLLNKFTSPCLLELIWSYWHEQGMLVQTLNAISQRFQNIRGPGERDPLAGMEIDPLRPLNNLLWSYIQDEQHRLSIVRRAYEYDHHYGLSLQGKAVPSLRSVESRSKFLEAYHNLLSLASVFFKEDDFTTVRADGFPILNALKDVHLILSQGAHNQFGDLPSTARQEMLIQQWLLARPEFQQFLPTRTMVAYPERWMDRVDAMKSVQGWTDASVLHFRNLGKFGEQILLSIRFGSWSDVNDPLQAANWARYWRPEIQGYIHAYRAVTGIDLTTDITDTSQAADRYIQPSVHLANRIATQQQVRPIPIPTPSANGAVRKIPGVPTSARDIPKKKV